MYGDEWEGYVRKAIKEPEEGYDVLEWFSLALI